MSKAKLADWSSQQDNNQSTQTITNIKENTTTLITWLKSNIASVAVLLFLGVLIKLSMNNDNLHLDSIIPASIIIALVVFIKALANKK